MSIAELLYNIVMEDGSPEAWQIIAALPKESHENVAKLWDAGYEDKIPNGNDLTRLQALVDGLKAGKYTFDSETGEPATDEEIHQMQKDFPLIFGKPDEEEHFGEQQAEGLDNLLEGLRDGPKDERW